MRHQQHLHSGLFGGVGGLHIVYVLAEPEAVFFVERYAAALLVVGRLLHFDEHILAHCAEKVV